MKVLRLGTSANLEFYSIDTFSTIKIPMMEATVEAGFPSPADDYIDLKIDLNKELVRHPAATFLVRVKGLSMRDEGIGDNDILVVDKSLDPKDGDIAVCCLDGDFTLKRIELRGDELYLMPANPSFKPIKINPEEDFSIWGIVTYVIKKFK